VRERLRIKTIREKITLSIFIVIALCGLFSAFIVSQVVQDQLGEKYEVDKVAATESLSYSLAPVLDLYDYKQVERIITSSLTYENIAYITVFSKGGIPVVSAAEQNVSPEDLDVEKYEMTSNDKVIGSIEIGFSREYIKEQIQTTTIVLTSGLAGFLILVGLALFAFINRSVISPLGAFTETVREIDSENLSLRVDIHSEDELGTLAKNFNRMADNLEEAHGALKQSETKLNIILSSIIDLIFVLDKDSKFTSFYVPSEKLVLHPKEFIGKRYSEVMPSYTHKLFAEAFDKSKKREVAEYEYWIEVGGKTEWYSVKLSPMIVDSEFEGCVAVARDITERKRGEQLEAEATATRIASQAKSDFLASMSHELRTPLNAVIGFSQVLQEQYFGDLNEKQAEYVSDILGSGQHLLSLINDILDLSKIEAGKMELELSRVKMKDLLKGSLVMIKEKALAHGISLDTHTTGELEELEIMADERRLKQVMFNLLSNAAKFTPDGGAITVVGKMEGKELIISVSDTGTGIAPEEQERVFEESYQTSSGIKDKTPGTGLGLPITRRIVEMHGGRIWMESEGQDKGSKFTFTLPV